MNVVVLGGTGYIGREVTRTLLSKVSKAHIFTVSRTGEMSFPIRVLRTCKPIAPTPQQF